MCPSQPAEAGKLQATEGTRMSQPCWKHCCGNHAHPLISCTGTGLDLACPDAAWSDMRGSNGVPSPVTAMVMSLTLVGLP